MTEAVVAMFMFVAIAGLEVSGLELSGFELSGFEVLGLEVLILELLMGDKVVMMIGVRMLSCVAARRHRVAVDRLCGGIETFDDIAPDALAMAAPAGVAMPRAAAMAGTVFALFFGL